MTTNALGVAAWLLAWSSSVGPEPDFAAASSEAENVTEGEVWFSSPVPLSIPATLPIEDDDADRFALLVYTGANGVSGACTYLSDAERYNLVVCDAGQEAGSVAMVDYAAVWSDVQNAGRAPGGGRIFIDFTGGGIVLSCGGNTYYLGNVEPSSIDVGQYCPAD